MANPLAYSLFLAHRSKLIEYAASIVGSRDQAEDVVQEAFLRFRPSDAREAALEQPLAYLYRIVRNHALDLLRRDKMEAERLGDAPAYWAAPRAEPTPEQATLHASDLEIVEKVLAGLPSHGPVLGDVRARRRRRRAQHGLENADRTCPQPDRFSRRQL